MESINLQVIICPRLSLSDTQGTSSSSRRIRELRPASLRARELAQCGGGASARPAGDASSQPGAATRPASIWSRRLGRIYVTGWCIPLPGPWQVRRRPGPPAGAAAACSDATAAASRRLAPSRAITVPSEPCSCESSAQGAHLASAGRWSGEVGAEASKPTDQIPTRAAV